MTIKWLLFSATLACSLWASAAHAACSKQADATPASSCVVMEREGNRGLWFELVRANEMRKSHLEVPELRLQVADLEMRGKTRDWQLEQYKRVVTLKDGVIKTQDQAITLHARRERKAREALDAWYRSPLLWAGIGAVVVVVGAKVISK